MSKLDPELCMYLKSSRASTRGALSALGLARIRMGNIVAGRKTDADRDAFLCIQETISYLKSAQSELYLFNYFNGHAGEVED